ncbi:MAG: translation initiation factor eIF-2B [Melioribacteraceae bacterium]|nr:translation initiation factor eIF-2B [Melioribacteraceae bacterium]MCF8353453.1 translation initiation factor eIF-2B [Melioribacteraceae bacterium]MCF8393941.1 translation initiation factor eIF-2B [Melioribacteraceae bacterium]MCF8419014.1 translation initiation factor eIF-2B [Melioribacteraceae bacterium]
MSRILDLKRFPDFENLKIILDDNTSGSSELLYKIQNYLHQNAGNISDLNSFLYQLKDYFNEFQVITSFLDRLIESGGNSLDKIISDSQEFSTKCYQRIFDNFNKNHDIPERIITISNSTTLFEIFKLFYNVTQNLEIRVCESRPQLEGRIFSSKLAEQGIAVKLITESQIPEFIVDCDCAVIGADKILPDNSIVNKVGSRLLAITANHFSVPFFVFASKNKNSDSDHFVPDERNTDEIWVTKNNFISIKNYYFETVNSKLITEIVQE